MKKVLRIIGAASWFTLAAFHVSPAHAYSYHRYHYQPQQPDESDLDRHGHYLNHDGNIIRSPAHSRSGQVPQGATAQCRDGSYSFSQHHSGTCSRHGGVSHWQ